MNIEQFRKYCISKKGVTEEFPFDNETLVFKVGSKIFALTNIEHFSSINLKCDPEQALLLREQHDYVIPGYHMNKKHWNTILISNNVSDKFIREWTDHSYHLVLKGLPKKEQAQISSL